MKISVAICTYNGEQFLKDQIDSILNQTLKVDEIIVCDDCSTDTTIEIVNNYAKGNPNLFKIIINETNLKSVKNFEKAIKLCSGEVIFLSDQDDIWALNKVEEYVNYFKENPKINVLASNGYCINENNEIEEKYAIWDVPQILRENNIEVDYYKLITIVSNIATGASMAFRKEFVPLFLPFPILENLHHDEWISIISSYQKSFELLNEKFFYYRIHSSQQVGGVFYKKTKRKKLMLYEIYNIFDNDTTFNNLKKRIKRLASAYSKNKKFTNIETEYKSLFEANLKEIQSLFFSAKNQMKSKFPFSYFWLNISDKVQNKRQLSQ